MGAQDIRDAEDQIMGDVHRAFSFVQENPLTLDSIDELSGHLLTIQMNLGAARYALSTNVLGDAHGPCLATVDGVNCEQKG